MTDIVERNPADGSPLNIPTHTADKKNRHMYTYCRSSYYLKLLFVNEYNYKRISDLNSSSQSPSELERIIEGFSELDKRIIIFTLLQDLI